MSTRSHIAIFEADSKSLSENWESLIYRHSDGYPGTVDGKEYGVLSEVVPFVRGFIKKRGWDSEYMAARLLQHLTNLYDGESSNPGIYGYGIAKSLHGDIEFLYAIYPSCIKVYDAPYDQPVSTYKLLQTIEW